MDLSSIPGNNICTDNWAGAHNPDSHPNSPSVLPPRILTLKYVFIHFRFVRYRPTDPHTHRRTYGQTKPRVSDLNQPAMNRETKGGANGCNMLVMEIDELVALYHMKSPTDKTIWTTMKMMT